MWKYIRISLVPVDFFELAGAQARSAIFCILRSILQNSKPARVSSLRYCSDTVNRFYCTVAKQEHVLFNELRKLFVIMCKAPPFGTCRATAHPILLVL
jgi:hypothetical protein